MGVDNTEPFAMVEPGQAGQPGQDPAPAVTPETPLAPEQQYPVIELFGPTIQGEGLLAGTKTLFVRFGGCDFKCAKCDSPHAIQQDAIRKHARYLTQAQIADELIQLALATGTQWVTFSGGNPAVWKLDDLTSVLHAAHIKVAVETQGTHWNDYLAKAHILTVSPKSPGMGEKFNASTFVRFMQKAYEARTPVCLKVVVFSAQDFEFALEVEELLFQADIPLNRNAFYLSQGNAYPPILDEQMNLVDNPNLAEAMALSNASSHGALLAKEFKILLEEYFQDKRLSRWHFLPQLHVWVWGNEAGK